MQKTKQKNQNKNWARPWPMTISPGLCHKPGLKSWSSLRSEFSPTSLVERAREWFISAAAPTLSSSSQLQAFGPNLTLCCCGPIGPSAGLNPGPGWVSSRIQAVVAQQVAVFKKNPVFWFCFLHYLFSFVFFLYFLILFAFRSAKL